MSQEIAAPTRVIYSNEQLRNIADFDSARELVSSSGTVLNVADAIGDGFELEKDKDKFLNQEMIILSWTHTKSDDYKARDGSGESAEYVTARVVTRRGKFLIVDGSAGICEQLRGTVLPADGSFSGMYAPRGLRKSEYRVTSPETGEVTTATTYYIDNARA